MKSSGFGSGAAMQPNSNFIVLLVIFIASLTGLIFAHSDWPSLGVLALMALIYSVYRLGRFF